jgi:hypothetical protein
VPDRKSSQQAMDNLEHTLANITMAPYIVKAMAPSA